MDLSNNVVTHMKSKNGEYLQFKRLLKYEDIISHAYSLGLDKNYRTYRAKKTPLPKEEYEKNINDYKILCQENGMNYKNIVKASQAHTDVVMDIVANEKNEENEENEENEKNLQCDGIKDTRTNVDGLITNEKNIVLATTNADCILLLYFDPIKKVIANTHSGWRGTLQEISVKTVQKMQKDYGCRPEDIIVCIAPSIRKCHFEVDEDVYKLFLNQFEKLGNVDDFITKKGEKWYIDTVFINKKILMQAGILEKNIEDCGICSVCNSSIVHSFRAEGANYGLATAVISLK